MNRLLRGLIAASFLVLGCGPGAESRVEVPCDPAGPATCGEGWECVPTSSGQVYKGLCTRVDAGTDPGPASGDLAGEADGPPDDLVLVASPLSVDFGAVQVGGASSVTVTLRHAGSAGTLVIGGVELRDASPGLAVEGPGQTVLEPGAETTVTVRFAPAAPGPATATLAILHNAPVQDGRTLIPVTAVAQVAELEATPDPIDFGSVRCGQESTLDVTLANVGTREVRIDRVFLEGAEAFALVAVVPRSAEAGDLPQSLAPGGTLGLVVRFAAAGPGAVLGTLRVDATAGDEALHGAFVVQGEGKCPRLVIAPGQIDFWNVPLGEKQTRLFTVSNAGNDSLLLAGGGMSLLPGSDPGLALPDAPPSARSIAPAESLDFHLEWTPQAAKPDDGQAIGQLSIASDDPAAPTVIPVYGKVAVAMLSVLPSDVVDFGFGAQMSPVTRTLTLRNDGALPLQITSVTIAPQAIADEFEIVGDTAWSADVKAGKTVEIAAGEALPLVLRFTNRGGDTGSVESTLTIQSNSIGGPVSIPLVAARVATPECRVTLVPAKLNFGTVASGFTKTLPMQLVNTGSGACSFKGAKLTDCSNSMGMSQCPDPATTAASKTFTFTSLPPMAMNGIAPGAAVTLSVRYAPTGTGSLFGQLTQHGAVLSVTLYDAARGVDVKVPACPTGVGGSQCTANVTGQSGVAKASVLPAEVAFGATTIGCYGRSVEVCAYNSGAAPLRVDDVSLVGCTPEFRLSGVPSLPKDVAAGAPLCFHAGYAPQDPGKDECLLQLKSGDSTASALSVALSGEGTYDTVQVDDFTQVSGQSVDILFVIDDSGSMCDKQDRLIQAYGSFIQKAQVWQNDYRIGFIDVNVLTAAIAGKLNRGDPKATPRFITPASQNPQTLFQNLANMGCDGCAKWTSCSGGTSDEMEAGLEAAHLALTAPNLTATGVACATTDDCRNDTTICASPKDCPYACLEGTCGGWNQGFLRDDARLEVVVLSDEEDQSPSNPGFYVEFLRSLKGYYNTGLMHLHAIVGVVDGSGTAQGAACTGSDGTMAQEGKRYAEVVAATGGTLGSICAADFGPTMEKIGNTAFGLKVQFPLSRLADPPTLQVRVDGVQVTGCWTYDLNSNSVVFDPNGSCVPKPGDAVKVRYDTVCLKS